MCLSGTGLQGQQPIRSNPVLPLPSHLLQLIQGQTEVFPGQPKNIIAPACPRDLSRGLLPGGAQETSLSDTKTFQCLLEWMNEWITSPISGALQRKLILVSHYPFRFRKGEKLMHQVTLPGAGLPWPHPGPWPVEGAWRRVAGGWPLTHMD